MTPSNKTLYFYRKKQFVQFRDREESKGFSINGIAQYIAVLCTGAVNILESLKGYDKESQIIDLSTFGTYDSPQQVAEQILASLPDDGYYIADIKYKELLTYELRYAINKFEEIPLDEVVVEETNDNNTKRYRRITDLEGENLSRFFEDFNNELYGHDKFKDDFRDLVETFKVFNKIGEHKILSLFLMGESGVGKTEVARAIHKCLGGKESLAKVNFGNYSNESSLNSLIGSARGYIGSEDGEIFIRTRNTDTGIILMDEFEKSNAALFNYFLDVLESGKIISSQAEEINLDGFIMIFTSNVSKDNYKVVFSPELRSRFDYKGQFTKLYKEDKEKFCESRFGSILIKYNKHFENKLNDDCISLLMERINVDSFTNMRDLNKKIKRTFISYLKQPQQADNPKRKINFLRSIASILN